MPQALQDDIFPALVQALGHVLSATALTQSDPLLARRVKKARAVYEKAQALTVLDQLRKETKQ